MRGMSITDRDISIEEGKDSFEERECQEISILE